MTHTTTDKATPPTRSEGTLTSLAQLFSQPINDAQVQVAAAQSEINAHIKVESEYKR